MGRAGKMEVREVLEPEGGEQTCREESRVKKQTAWCEFSKQRRGGGCFHGSFIHCASRFIPQSAHPYERQTIFFQVCMYS